MNTFKIYTTQPELDARDGRVNWFGSAFMMHKRGPLYDNFDFTPDDVQWLADLANTGKGVFRTEDGGVRELTSVVGQPFILDFEPWMDVRYRSKIFDYIRRFAARVPNTQIGMYPGGWLHDATKGWMNNDDLYLCRRDKVDRFLKGLDDFTQIALLLDFICPSIYPLEKPAWKRDQFVNRMMVGWCRRFNKPVYPFMFGGWRDFRGDRVEKISKMNVTELSQYAEIAREECDGAIVWGSKPGGGVWPGNQTLIDLLER